MKTLLTIVSVFILTASFAQRDPNDCLNDLKLPTSFTPNGDAINDFVFVTFDCAPDEFKIEFFNNWGEVIFESIDYKFAWDGSSDSKSLPIGVYSWALSYTFKGNEVKKSGDITMIR
ncbi:MAG: gliding motility-associated-like protein [Arenicella sp.]|jgi:gliding motility-associated-like protein